MRGDTEDWAGRAAAWGLGVALLLIAAAVAVPHLTGWQVWPRSDQPQGVAPLHGRWGPAVGPGSLPAVLLAVAAVGWGDRTAQRLTWRRLLLIAYVVGLAWLASLALVNGTQGFSRMLGNPDEYLPTARSVTSVHTLLTEYVDRIPFSAGALHWPIQIAGHPPGLVLFFVALVHLGLGGDLAAGLVVTALAATIAPAAMVVLRAVGREPAARSAAPYLVMTPAAVFLAVSGDAVIATVVAWGLACLALATRRRLTTGWPWAVLAGLLLGYAVMMSYGLPLAGLIALAVLFAARTWWPLPVAAVAASAVVATFAVAGFAWWDAYPVLVQRYWDGVAARRPAAYWLWGDLASLLISAGPLLGAALPAAWVRRRLDARTLVVVAAAVAVIVVADVSRMSKAEVERIWLPFVPWLTLSCTFLPSRWRRPGLALQVGTALLVQHLLYTSW